MSQSCQNSFSETICLLGLSLLREKSEMLDRTRLKKAHNAARSFEKSAPAQSAPQSIRVSSKGLGRCRPPATKLVRCGRNAPRYHRRRLERRIAEGALAFSGPASRERLFQIDQFGPAVAKAEAAASPCPMVSLASSGIKALSSPVHRLPNTRKERQAGSRAGVPLGGPVRLSRRA
jgi:hypothetical protein